MLHTLEWVLKPNNESSVCDLGPLASIHNHHLWYWWVPVIRHALVLLPPAYMQSFPLCPPIYIIKCFFPPLCFHWIKQCLINEQAHFNIQGKKTKKNREEKFWSSFELVKNRPKPYDWIYYKRRLLSWVILDWWERGWEDTYPWSDQPHECYSTLNDPLGLMHLLPLSMSCITHFLYELSNAFSSILDLVSPPSRPTQTSIA